MRFKGRYINDRKLQNVQGERICEQNCGDGVTRLYKEIDAICMEPDRSRITVEPVKSGHNLRIYLGLGLSLFVAGCSIVGIFYNKLFLASLTASVFWMIFVSIVNARRK